MMKARLSICLFFVLNLPGFAQTDTCIQHLKDAQTDYSNGLYDQVVVHVQVALKNCPLDKADKIELYKLLILSDLNIDNLEEADKAAGQILRLDPNFKPNKLKDDPKLIELFSKYRPVPTLAVGIVGGMNKTRIDQIKVYSVSGDEHDPNLGSYQARRGFQLGVFVQKRLIQNLWLKAGFEYRESSYEHALDSILGSTVYYVEDLKYYEFPVQLKYEFLKGAIRPFVYSGAKFSFLNKAISTTVQLDKKDLVDRTSLRNTFLIGFTAGLGISYQIKAFQIFAQADYCHISKNVNKEGTRYNDPINLFKYYYVDDDFRMQHVSISVGGIYNLIYRQRKLR